MIEHIVFDIGNVLITFAPETYFIRWFQGERKTHRVCSCTFIHEAWEKYDRGTWMLEDLCAMYHGVYLNMVEETDIVLQNWSQLIQPMQESTAFMKQMENAGYGIYIPSNISQDFVDYLKETRQLSLLADGAVSSYEKKTGKPDPYIFEVLLERYELNAEELLYLDDNVGNTRQAGKMGIQGALFTDEGCTVKAQKLSKEECHVKDQADGKRCYHRHE